MKTAEVRLTVWSRSGHMVRLAIRLSKLASHVMKRRNRSDTPRIFSYCSGQDVVNYFLSLPFVNE